MLLNVSFLNLEAAQAIPIDVVYSDKDIDVLLKGSKRSSENLNSETSMSGNLSLKKVTLPF